MHVKTNLPSSYSSSRLLLSEKHRFFAQKKNLSFKSLNKIVEWHMDGTSIDKSTVFSVSSNLYTIRVTIWGYSGFSDARFYNLPNNKKIWISCVGKALFDRYYLNSAHSRQMVGMYFAIFKRVRTNIDKNERSDRPYSPVVQANIKNVHVLVFDRWLFWRYQ